MENEGKLRQDMNRGEKAQALLRNEILIETFDFLEKQYHDAWANSSVDQNEAREKVFMMLQNLQTVKQHIESVVITGKLANDQLTK
jgi:exo-beta-1,3-glucanase (GH17 family)|tara:strand:+ start:120 stop:377 length:258 start_codon:yes stop_codon:yes gene_type:complete